MDNSVISMVENKSIFMPVLIENAYKFMPKGRLIWLQKLLWKMLFKFKAMSPHYDKTETITSHIINRASFVERLFKHQEVLHGLNKDGQTLLIGAQDYHELMCGEEFRSTMRFEVEYRKGICNQTYIFGLKVIVIPYMSGMIVVPAGTEL